MPSNEQRRAAAKRKLERQLASRAERARKRKRLSIAGSALGVVIVVAAVTGVYFLTKGDDADNTAAEPKDASLTSAPPPAAKAKPAQVTCDYRDGRRPADKPVHKPERTQVPTTGNDAKVSLSVETSAGPLGLTLNNAESPCTVNSFMNLVDQRYFNDTSCHRMTATDGLKVLQCGDPVASGMGGPGYEFDNEYPTDQYAPNDPTIPASVAYKRGVLAMANANSSAGSTGLDGMATNGSQFFIVYGDSELPPQYTIFGTVDENSLKTLDKIAQGGQDNSNGPGDGKPNTQVTIQSVRLDR
ncbi:peptidylprolyl isomerase [Nocardia bovistercoris]|uniref:Peptidylprolyl isomerase n=1 Tax=Nocardia bovistercoris TaxID=2785916 RepID=A0A931I4X9_9NOCA|nr:peptidylprolyl isomerase [Nocardia bovistercoris]